MERFVELGGGEGGDVEGADLCAEGFECGEAGVFEGGGGGGMESVDVEAERDVDLRKYLVVSSRIITQELNR